MLSNEQKLLELKKRILARKDKNSAILLELQELNKNILEAKPDNSDMVKLLGELISKIDELEIKPEIKVESKEVKVEPIIEVKQEKTEIPQFPTEIKVSNLDEVKADLKGDIVVDFPKEFKVSNLNEIRPTKIPDKVKVDWENAPKTAEQKDYVSQPLKALYKSIESLLGKFFSKIYDFISLIEEYITQPDRITVSKNQIVEYYGNRKVVYRIKDDGNERSVTRES